MLTSEATPEMLSEWRSVWREYRDRLTPNRKSGGELLAYLLANYPLTETRSRKALETVRQNVLRNECFAEKLPPGAAPEPRAFFLENRGTGAPLYQNREKVFCEVKRILVGVDLASGFYLVEGSSALWDELCAFRGLDEEELQNPFCVAQYVACLQRFLQHEGR